MQAFSISLSDAPYSADMKTGRPSKHPRTPFGERALETTPTDNTYYSSIGNWPTAELTRFF